MHALNSASYIQQVTIEAALDYRRAYVVYPCAGEVRTMGDKQNVFMIADCGTGQRYVIPTKAVDALTVQLLLAERK